MPIYLFRCSTIFLFAFVILLVPRVFVMAQETMEWEYYDRTPNLSVYESWDSKNYAVTVRRIGILVVGRAEDMGLINRVGREVAFDIVRVLRELQEELADPSAKEISLAGAPEQGLRGKAWCDSEPAWEGVTIEPIPREELYIEFGLGPDRMSGGARVSMLYAKTRTAKVGLGTGETDIYLSSKSLYPESPELNPEMIRPVIEKLVTGRLAWDTQNYKLMGKKERDNYVNTRGGITKFFYDGDEIKIEAHYQLKFYKSGHCRTTE